MNSIQKSGESGGTGTGGGVPLRFRFDEFVRMME
jgi:hypothetical protein